MILARIDESNYWTGSWREFSEGDTMPDDGIWVEVENIPTETRDVRERRCWKYNKPLNFENSESTEETKSEVWILDEDKISEYNKEKTNKDIKLQIRKMKDELSSSDYKIIKAYEFSLVGKECEYDIKALHEQRQLLRDKINELEAELL